MDFWQGVIHNIMKTFTDWLKESTAFMRARLAAANGTGPSIPDAEINSHDTARPWVAKAIKKRNKRKKKY
jgi:hypothetical protein